MLEQHEQVPKMLEAVNAMLSAAPSSTKNGTGIRDPEMHQVKKGKQWLFGVRADVRVNVGGGLLHAVLGTVADVNDVTQDHALFALSNLWIARHRMRGPVG